MLIAEVDQTSLASSVRHTKASASIRVLPEELYELVRAGISNAIERAISDNLITGYGRSAESLEKVFLDEISAPTPQISRFIRNHKFIWSFSAPKGWSRREALEISGYKAGSKRSAQRRYDQDVYDFSRNLGLPIDVAEKWVLKARDFWYEKGFDSTDTEESDDVSSWDEMPNQSSRASSPEMFRLPLVPIEHDDEAPRNTSSGGFQANRSQESGGTSVFGVSQALTCEGESTFRCKEKIEDTVQPITRNQFVGARQLQQRQLQNLEGSDRRSEENVNMPATLRPPILGDRSLVDDVVGLVEDSSSTEAVVNGYGENPAMRAVTRAVKASRSAKGEADKGAMTGNRAGKHEHIGNPEEQMKMASNSEQLSQFEQFEVKDKPPLQKENRRKRKREHDLLPQSYILFGESHKHQKSRVDGKAQDVSSRKGKRGPRGPQQSPFFQRNNVVKAKKKDGGMKAQQHMGFQPPMIQ